jgi:hypothetical protein
MPEAVRLLNGPEELELWVVPTSAMEQLDGPSPPFPGQTEIVQRLKEVLRFCERIPTETITELLDRDVGLGGLLGSITSVIPRLSKSRVCPDCEKVIPRRDAYDVLTISARIHGEQA